MRFMRAHNCGKWPSLTQLNCQIRLVDHLRSSLDRVGIVTRLTLIRLNGGFRCIAVVNHKLWTRSLTKKPVLSISRVTMSLRYRIFNERRASSRFLAQSQRRLPILQKGEAGGLFTSTLRYVVRQNQYLQIALRGTRLMRFQAEQRQRLVAYRFDLC